MGAHACRYLKKFNSIYWQIGLFYLGMEAFYATAAVIFCTKAVLGHSGDTRTSQFVALFDDEQRNFMC